MFVGRPSERVESFISQRAVCLMGVLNVTPDSFYDGGRHEAPARALERVAVLVAQGSHILDIGGESSRPGSTPVPAEEQVRRLEPAVRHAVEDGRALVSIDTASAEVAERMLALGAHIVNDVSCLRDDELARVTARAGAILVVMHSREPMSELEGFSRYPDGAYDDVVSDVLREWRLARDRAVSAGMRPEHVWLDPGLGFAKNARHSFEILKRLDELTGEGVPVVVGPSRKSFVARFDRSKPDERLGGTIAACLHAVDKGARVLRVHDVLDVRQALDVTAAARGRPPEEVTDAR